MKSYEDCLVEAQAKADALRRNGLAGMVVVTIHHESWCDMVRRKDGRCNCSPTVGEPVPYAEEVEDEAGQPEL